jgi:hypothetical protein
MYVHRALHMYVHRQHQLEHVTQEDMMTEMRALPLSAFRERRSSEVKRHVFHGQHSFVVLVC